MVAGVVCESAEQTVGAVLAAMFCLLHAPRASSSDLRQPG